MKAKIESSVSGKFKNLNRFEPGQTLWLGVAVNDSPSHGMNAQKIRLKPVVITLWSKDDWQMKIVGYWNKEILDRRIARIFMEAYEQGALFSIEDVALLLGVSPSTVGEKARAFMEREKIIIPTRGVITGLGTPTTHIKIIIMQYLSGYSTPEISRSTKHPEEAIDRYIREFEMARSLRDRAVDYIHRETGISQRLINFYLGILKDWEE